MYAQGVDFGKTRLTTQRAVIDALTFPGTVDPLTPETILLTEPTLVMARQLLWQPLVSLCESPMLADSVESINKSEFKIVFKGGKPPIVVAGTNDRDGDGLRGKRLYRFYGDEFQDVKPGIFDMVIRAAMADTRGSRAQITFTPKGKLNHTYELIQRAEVDPDTYWYCHAKTTDNPFVPREEVETARLTLPPRVFRQEFEASIEDFPGRVFSELDEGNICDTAPDSFDYTILGIDWGETHPAVVVIGVKGETWFILEGWQGFNGLPVPQPTFDGHLVRLAAKWGISAAYCDPSRPSSILGVRMLGKEHRLKGLTKAVAGYNRIEDGLTQMLSKIYCKRLLFPRRVQGVVPNLDMGMNDPLAIYELFSGYHRATDKAGNVTEKIEDGQDDHLIDAARYAIAIGKGQLDET